MGMDVIRAECRDHWLRSRERSEEKGSVTPTISDAGSDDSALSITSSGLRKPIPMEGVGFELGSLCSLSFLFGIFLIA